jgi:hypothetical protein
LDGAVTRMTAGAWTDESPAAPEPGRALVRAWLGVLLPPAGWIADFLCSYFAVRFASVHERTWPLWLATAGGVAAVAVGAALSWEARRGATVPSAPGRRDDASALSVRSLAGWGLALAAFFLLLILANAYPLLALGPREIT